MMNRFFVKGLIDVLKKIKDGTASDTDINELWTYCEKTFGYKIEAQDSDKVVKEAVKE